MKNYPGSKQVLQMIKEDDYGNDKIVRWKVKRLVVDIDHRVWETFECMYWDKQVVKYPWTQSHESVHDIDKLRARREREGWQEVQRWEF
jgi:hypothetical protein